MKAPRGFKEAFADIGIEIPDEFSGEELETILEPYLKGEKGRYKGQDVYARLIVAMIALGLKERR